MSRIKYLILLNLLSVFTFAQTTLITGKVVIDDGVAGQDAVDNILVTNESTNAKAFTNASGMFSIKASVGDELIFTHDFYIERKIKITLDILAKGMLTIHLNIETIELAEARINTLDKNFKNNIKLKYDQVDEMYKQRDKVIKIHFGKPIDYKIFDKRFSDKQWAEQVKKYVYTIGRGEKTDFNTFLNNN